MNKDSSDVHLSLRDGSFQAISESIKDLAHHVHPSVPNPAPLGLIAFGLTTALLQLKHTRITENGEGVDIVVMGFAMFFGGLLQIIAGLSEIKRNNIFGYTAFCLYGGFWMSVGTVEIVSTLATGEPASSKIASEAMLFMVSVFTFMLWIMTFKLNKTICSLFFLLGCTTMLLSFGVRNEDIDIVGGWFGIATSVNAFWLAFVELYNDIFGEGAELIPLGHWRANRFRGAGGAHAPGWTHGHRPHLFAKRFSKSENPGNGDVEEGTIENVIENVSGSSE